MTDGRHHRFDRARLARLFEEGLAQSTAEDDAARLLDAIEYTVRRSQPDAVR